MTLSEMTADLPFIKCIDEQRRRHDNSMGTYYYLLNTRGQKTPVAFAYFPNQYTNQKVFHTHPGFIQNYGGEIGFEENLHWTSYEEMAPWLDAVIHNSFIFQSTPGVPNCWHIMTLKSMDLVGWKLLPQGLSEIFNNEATSTWVLFRVGSKTWPIRVVENVFEYGWNEFCNVHRLNNETKLILATERQWIFDVIVLDEQDAEVDFKWSKGHNIFWQTSNISEDAVRTSCLPSALINQVPIIRFGYFHRPMTKDIEEFERKLRKVTGGLHLRQIIVTIRHQTWTIPYVNNAFEKETFKVFIDMLKLSWGDYVFVTLIADRRLRVIVFHKSKQHERLFDWL